MYMRAQYPSVPVIVVSANDDPAVIRRCMEFGASGFIPKTLGVESMRGAISRILGGGVWTPPDVDLAGGSDAEAAELMARMATLTPQQVRVLMMLSEGLLNKQIAYQLGVSEATVKAHVSAILQKLGVESRTQAVIAAAKIEAGQWPQSVGSRRLIDFLLGSGNAQHAPLRQQRAQSRRLERLVQHLNAFVASQFTHVRRAVCRDENCR